MHWTNNLADFSLAKHHLLAKFTKLSSHQIFWLYSTVGPLAGMAYNKTILATKFITNSANLLFPNPIMANLSKFSDIWYKTVPYDITSY